MLLQLLNSNKQSMFIQKDNVKEKLKQKAIDTIDFIEDPYFYRISSNKVIRCKLCITIHRSESSYLAHTQGKRHLTNLKIKRKSKSSGFIIKSNDLNSSKNHNISNTRQQLGLPGYTVEKFFLPLNKYKVLMLKVDYANSNSSSIPDYRIMTTYEQTIENHNQNYKFLIVSREESKSLALKIPNLEIAFDTPYTFSYWYSLLK